MTEIRYVSFIGLGAIGCTCFPFISKILPFENVRIIANGSRKVRMERNGVTINGKRFDLFITPPDEEVVPADLIIVAVKYPALQDAINDMKNHVGPNTTILSLMNGINSRDEIGERYGIDKCLYGLSNQSAVNNGDGSFTISQNRLGTKFGEAVNQKPFSERVQAISRLFDKAGISYEIPQDMVHDTWWKFMLNVSGNSTNSLLRGTQSYFQKLNSANKARRLMMGEVLSLSKVMKTGLTESDVDEIMTAYKAYPGENKCSMLQDIEAGRKTENEMLCGAIVKLGEKYHVHTPINEYVYYMIQALDDISNGVLEQD